MFSGGLCACGFLHHRLPQGSLASRVFPALPFLILGALTASMLNAASNALNQYTDFEIDAINKSARPLPSGRMSKAEGLGIAVVLYCVGLIAALFIVPYGRPDYFLLALAGSFLTYLYSARPIRAKRFLWWSNLTIALPRGCLLFVAGWSCVAPVWSNVEPWYIGATVLLFIFGAGSTKDFSDMEGDRALGCTTLPIRFGPRRAAWMIAPFLTLPWLLLPLGAFWKVPDGHSTMLSGNPVVLAIVGIGLCLYGLFVDSLLLARPEELTRKENHPSWKHMYLMMMVSQIGLAVAYLTS